MNGDNFYARQNATQPDPQPPIAQSTGLVGNGVPTADQLPSFTTYDSKSQGITDDDRMPLNASTPSNHTAPSKGMGADISEDGSEKYVGMGRGTPAGGTRGGHGGPFNAPRDEFGNLLPPSNAFGPAPPVGFRR